LGLSLEIDLLRSFAVIAEVRALSRAASRVGRTQSALSQQMKRLEEIVDQPLFQRTGRGVVLTNPGERLLIHAQRILRLHDEAMADLSGSYRLVFFATAGIAALSAAVAWFEARSGKRKKVWRPASTAATMLMKATMNLLGVSRARPAKITVPTMYVWSDGDTFLLGKGARGSGRCRTNTPRPCS